MAQWKKRSTFLFLFLLFFLAPLLLSGGGTGNPKAFAGSGKVDIGSLSFEKNGEAPVIRFDGEEIYAYFQTADKLLTVDGTDEISLARLLEGGEISLTFHVTSLEGQNPMVASKAGSVNLTLSDDPIYWRLVTDKDDLGVGTFTIKAPEKLKELLPQEIKGLTTVYQISGAEKGSKGILLKIKRNENDSNSSGYIADERLILSRLPEEFSQTGSGKSKGELIGKLKIAADYDFRVPLDEYSSAIQGKLTLVIWKDVYNN